MQAALLKTPRFVSASKALKRIGIVFAAIEDARQPRPLDEVVRQNFVPEVDDFLRLGEEAMAADVEQEILVAHRAADAADIDRIFLDHEHRRRFPWSGNRPRSGRPGRRR